VALLKSPEGVVGGSFSMRSLRAWVREVLSLG
jgi:hypothetical protein